MPNYILLSNICPQTEETDRRTRDFLQMDINARKLLLFFVAGFLENIELKVTCSPHVLECNTTALHLEMEACGGYFKNEMVKLHSKYWCDFNHFISAYHYFTFCAENNSVKIGCFWPHPVVESYIILIHEQFFSNCTNKNKDLSDEDTFHSTINIIIIVTVLLTLAMVTSVVFCSKQR